MRELSQARLCMIMCSATSAAWNLKWCAWCILHLNGGAAVQPRSEIKYGYCQMWHNNRLKIDWTRYCACGYILHTNRSGIPSTLFCCALSSHQLHIMELQVDQTSEAIEAQPQAAAPKQSRRALKLGKGRSHYNTQSLFEHVCFAANIRNSKRIGVVLGTALNLATGKYMDSLLLGYKICLAIEVSPWFRYISFVWYYVFHFADEESRWLIDYRWRCGKFSLMFYSQGFWLWHPSVAKQVQTRIETVLIWGDNTAKASCKSWFHHRACGCSERSDALTCEMPFRCFPDGMPARTMGTVGLCWGQCPVDCSQKLACN